MVHKWDTTLKTLLELLDDSRNDIFIHVDKKCKNFPFFQVENLLKKSSCIFVKRVNTTWGGMSQITTELILLDAACKTGLYDYYHLISGQDLPLKSQDEIHNFFRKERGKEFLRFYSEDFGSKSRVQYYWLLQESCGRGNTISTLPFKILQLLLVTVQKVLHVNRGKNIRFQKGSNWFSITDSFARYVLSKKVWIQKTFRFSFCADEIFMQTILFNSPYLEKLYCKNFDNDMHAIMRLIIWERKGPHVFTMSDRELIDKTDMLWGRKFDANTDKTIINYLKEKCLIN